MPDGQESLRSWPSRAAGAPGPDLDPVFKALADRHRRQILDLLRERGGQPLVRLCEQLDGMTRQAVAKHVAVLEGCGLVVSTRSGREKLHHLNPVPIHEIHRRWISRYDTDVLAALDHLKDTLQEGDDPHD